MYLFEIFYNSPKPTKDTPQKSLYDEAVAERTILVIYPGRFQPFHRGHKAVYDHLVGKFGRDHVYITTSNKVEPPRSPFSFTDKVEFMHLTGVPNDRIVESSQPYRAPEIVSKYNPSTTVLVIAVSEKDMAEDPRFSFKNKKDGSPSYMQPFPKNIKDASALEEHGYIVTVPTVEFTVLGQPMRSATELRAQFANADVKTQKAIVKDLFGKFSNEAYHIMKTKIKATSPAVAENKNPFKISSPALPGPAKPRNPVAKNVNKASSGAGVHIDRKKAMKQGEVKYKKDMFSEKHNRGGVR